MVNDSQEIFLFDKAPVIVSGNDKLTLDELIQIVGGGRSVFNHDSALPLVFGWFINEGKLADESLEDASTHYIASTDAFNEAQKRLCALHGEQVVRMMSQEDYQDALGTMLQQLVAENWTFQS